MKNVEILITNYNGCPALELCLESIIVHTEHPYEITVYDDASTNKRDLEYLRAHRDIGWLSLIEGKRRVGHGGALNVLLNKHCRANLAMIMDNDVQILKKDWLKDMVDLIDDDVLLVSGIENIRGMPWFQSWFMMLNMEIYREGLQINWEAKKDAGIFFPTGAFIYPFFLEYKRLDIPDAIKAKFRHYAHFSCLSGTTDKSKSDVILTKRKMLEKKIEWELKRLREKNA